jgi:hypothetical protein
VTARNAAARPVVEWARGLGCNVEWSRGTQHWKVTYRGEFAGTIAGTPSCPRSMLNAKSFIRRRIRAVDAANRTTQST